MMTVRSVPSEEELRAKQLAENQRKIGNRNAAITAYATLGAFVLAAIAFGVTRWEGEPDQPLGVVQTYGANNRGCGTDQLAMFTEAPPESKIVPLNSLALDVKKVKTAKLWGTSLIQYTLTAGADSSYTILDLAVVDATALTGTPNWLYSRSWDGCGSIGDRIVRLNLDVDSQQLKKAPLGAGQPAAGGGGLFDPFSVTKDATFAIEVQAFACQTSQRFSMELTYQKAGDSKVSQETFGPYEIFAAKTSLPTYQGTWAGQDQLLKLTDQQELIKSIQGCLK